MAWKGTTMKSAAQPGSATGNSRRDILAGAAASAGLLLALVLSAVGFGLAKLPGLSLIGPLAVTLVIAMIVKAVVTPPLSYAAGFSYAAKSLLRFGIVGLLGISLSSLSYAAGLWLKSEDALAPLLNMVSVPVLLLSGILLPMTLAPRWLQRLADINPFSHVVNGARAAFRNDFTDHSLVIGLVSAALLAVVGLAVATRTFQRESA